MPCKWLGPCWFQSAPGGEAGGNVLPPCIVQVVILFQSAPGGEAGGNQGGGCAICGCKGFNPPPAVRPGETLVLRNTIKPRSVSIRPRR